MSAALALPGPSADFLSHLALWAWLSAPPHNPVGTARHAELLKEALARAETSEATWDFVLPRLVGLGEWEFCVGRCRRLWPRHRPSPAARRYGPAGMACLLALRQTCPALSVTEMAATQHKFLARMVPEFFGRGLYDYFALWVKLLTQAGAGKPAQDAVRNVALRYT